MAPPHPNLNRNPPRPKPFLAYFGEEGYSAPMNHNIPVIIQGGMGAGVSNWRLARAVSWLGQLGVVAGTALDQILSRRLQDGDQEGHIRRALASFPFPKIAQKIIDAQGPEIEEMTAWVEKNAAQK